MVKLRIKKDLEWGEYIVQWVEDGRVNEERSYYSGGADPDHAEDSVYTLIAMIDEARHFGITAEPNDDKKTIGLIAKYRPDFLLQETRRELLERGIT